MHGCTARLWLPEKRARAIENIPDGLFYNATAVQVCELDIHPAHVDHAAFLQIKYGQRPGDYTAWWARWRDGGGWRIVHESQCLARVGADQLCLLIADHPGRCSTGRTA